MGVILLVAGGSSLRAAPDVAPATPATSPASWEATGWGGGGFYYAAAFSPGTNGVIYLAGDVGGAYKSEDNGRTWRMINTGIAGYGVFSLAVDPTTPQNVYAATDGGLCKSTDAGEHWTLLPQARELHLSGIKGKSIRCVAVNPTNSNIVYSGTPTGKVYKSTDGGQTFSLAYQKQSGGAEDPDALRVQFGKVNDAFFGGFWLPFAFPKGSTSADCLGFGFTFKGDGSTQSRAYLILKTSTGATYQSKNLNELFRNTQTQDVLLKAADFTLDADYAKKHPDTAQALASPDWSTVNRLDFSCAGDLPVNSSIGMFGKFFFAFTKTPDGKTWPVDAPGQVMVKDFNADKTVQTYGNIHTGSATSSSTVFTVAVSPKEPATVIAATSDSGLVLSVDAGQTWTELPTPKKATAVTFDPTNPNVIYGGFATDGIWKSTDKGKTWIQLSQGLSAGSSIVEIVVNPANSPDVYAIGNVGWGGSFFQSHDGGQTWKSSGSMTTDRENDPTLPGDAATTSPLSTATNLAINPLNPKELYISANWRSCLSEDGGQTWTERERGADISCISDIRFSGNRVYTCAMDEGSFMSEDDGKSWKQLWPLKFSDSLSGHNWRIGVSNVNGVDQIISTVSPWNIKNTDRVVVSQDGGKTFKIITEGLPDYIVRPNTMWGQGHPRALAVDPKDPKIVYLGIDGDVEPGKSGGGVFKSTDGGITWTQLPNQPGSRRMFYGLVVDPTDSNRIYWGCCNTGGGLYRSDDAGNSWKHVFSNELWIFNVLVTADGTVYCPGNGMWRSTDHGNTWKELTSFPKGGQIMGLEVDPRDSKTLWASNTKGVFKTTDSGATWSDITGDLQYPKPLILRFNPATNELWAGWVGLFKIKQ